MQLITENAGVFQGVGQKFRFLMIRNTFWLCSTYSVKRL